MDVVSDYLNHIICIFVEDCFILNFDIIFLFSIEGVILL